MSYQLTPLQKEIVAGLATGTLTTIAVHPLDLVKIRLQLLATSSERRGYKYIINSIVQTASSSQENGPRLLKEAYRGLGINLIGNAIAWGLYFGLYRATKDRIYNYNVLKNDHHIDHSHKDSTLSPLMYLSAGAISGLWTSILTNPIWVIKTRIMSTSRHERSSYKSTLDGIKRLLGEEGVRGLFKGLIPSLFGVSQGAIYFMLYDTLKHRYSSLRHYKSGNEKNQHMKTSETLVISSVSKLISVIAVYPFQLLKSNLQSFQASKENYTIMKLIKSIYEAEGTFGLYKGLSANLFRAIPSTCITFCIYENLKHWL